MYTPPLNAERDPAALHAFMEANPFATLVTASVTGLMATHLPLVLHRAGGVHGALEGHLARANPHHKEVLSVPEALVIFSGPDAYISPTWYPSKEQHGKVVPTWNYVAVHAHGVPRFFDDDASLREHLDRLTARHERGRLEPWSPADAPQDYIAAQQRAIVGFRLEITRLEGKWKMSQNRPDRDIDGVIEALGNSPAERDRTVAAIVNARRPRREGPR